MAKIKELWKPIPGYEGKYEASNLGRVRSLSRIVTMYGGRTRLLKGRVLSACTGRYRHLKFGDSTTHLVHRCIALAWIPNPENKKTVNHKDGDKLNNKASNLEWATSKENVRHAFDNKLMKTCHGSNHYMSKLTDKKVTKIRRLYNDRKMRSKDIAVIFNISARNVRSIIQGKTWKHCA